MALPKDILERLAWDASSYSGSHGAATHLEDRHCAAQRIRLVGHRMRGCGGFVHQRGVLLCDFFNLANGHIDLLDAGALLSGCRQDLAYDLGHAMH